MTFNDIAQRRLVSQRIAGAPFAEPAGAVAWLGAVQAQDYASAKFAVGLRCSGMTDADLERAIAERTIVRTWSLRGTLHLIAAADIRWLLGLVGPTVLARTATRYEKSELDGRNFLPIDRALVETLEGENGLTRKELFAALEERGIATGGTRGNQILYRAALSGRICLGELRGKQTTYTLLEEWVPGGTMLEGDEALAELARRYFISHGPATLGDFAWWSSLLRPDARAALAMAAESLRSENIGGTTYWMDREAPIDPSPSLHLLPAFDEYLVSYSDRTPALDRIYFGRVATNNGIFNPSIVIGGRVVGTWKRTITAKAVIVTANPFEPMGRGDQHAFAEVAERFGTFLGMPVVME